MTNEAIEAAALLPCPFCGGANVYALPPALGQSGYFVFCDDCHAQGPVIQSYNSDEAEARAKWCWNIRAALPVASRAAAPALPEVKP